MDIAAVRHFTVGQLLSVRKGVTFLAEEREARFVGRRIAQDKEAITIALGWKQA